MTSNVPEHWRVITGDALPFRNWDGDYVVYNPLSGSTHILDVVSGEVLALLASGPRLRGELCEGVAAFLEVPADENIAANVDRIIDVLDELGLVEPAVAC